MTNFLAYQCSLCGTTYAKDEVQYTCPACGDLGNLDLVLDYEAINRVASPDSIAASHDPSHWRYLPLLPVSDPGLNGTPLRNVGGTPLYRAERLAATLGLKSLFVKDDGRNPTGSFKDRASSVVVARALEIGAGTVVTASTGNAGAALAGMAAAAGLPAVIFAPQSAPVAKVAQLLMFGARVILIKGNYDQAFELSIQAAQEFGWYCRNTGYNPFTAEGKKTAAFEVAEQLGWRAPDKLFVSVGDGNIITGLWKGFKDLQALGWIDRVPELMGVQAEGSAACANAWAENVDDVKPVAANTLADSIAVDLPRDGMRAVRAVRETGGAYVVVTDDDILAAMRSLARDAAVFAEPAGAAAYAGLVKAVRDGRVGVGETVVVINTGNGLKDVQSAMKAAGEADSLIPNSKL